MSLCDLWQVSNSVLTTVAKSACLTVRANCLNPVQPITSWPTTCNAHSLTFHTQEAVANTPQCHTSAWIHVCVPMTTPMREYLPSNSLHSNNIAKLKYIYSCQSCPAWGEHNFGTWLSKKNAVLRHWDTHKIHDRSESHQILVWCVWPSQDQPCQTITIIKSYHAFVD